MAAGHYLDARVQVSRDSRADLIRRCQQVEARPPWRCVADEPDGLVAAQAQRFGVDDADVEALGCGVRSDVSHAEHGQREVVGSEAEAVVAQGRVDDARVEWLREGPAGDGAASRYFHAGS